MYLAEMQEWFLLPLTQRLRNTFVFADLFILEFETHFYWTLIAYKVLELPVIQEQKPA